MDPPESVKQGFFKTITRAIEAQETLSNQMIQEMRPVTKIESHSEIRYSHIKFNMDEIDLFLQIGRRVIDKGRKSLQRLTKIESNLRELRMKYVVSTGGADFEDDLEDESDLEIPVNELHLVQEHRHEEFVYD